MGSDELALPALAWVAEAYELRAVYTQPDRKRGRGQKVVPNAIKSWSVERGIAVRQPEKVGPEEVAFLREAGIDLVLVMAYGHILKSSLLEAPRLGCVNLHASRLPKLRGASPIETAIATGEVETGVSLMRIIKRMDAGAVADRERVAIGPTDTAMEVRSKMAEACVPLVARTLPKLASGELAFEEQEESAATYCRMLTKEDGKLDFQASAKELYDRVRAFHVWPGTFYEVAEAKIKVGSAAWSEDTVVGGEPGTVGALLAEGLPVATGAGTLWLRELQRPGGKMLAVGEFLRGFAIAPGTVLRGEQMAPLVFDRPYRREA